MDHLDAVEYFLSSPRRTRYQFVAKRWFVYDDGDWVWDEANIRINRAIIACTREMKWVKGGMVYNIDRVRRLLAFHLRTDRLPAHFDADVTPAGPPSELQAPAASPGPVPLTSPGLPGADPSQEQVDQADTASPDGHTP